MERQVKRGLMTAADEKAALGRITTPEMRAWMAHLRSNGASSRSLARKLSAVKSFCRWLAEQATEAAPPADAAAARGAEIFDAVGCAACHTVRGTPFQGTDGPDLTHLAGRRSLGAMTLSNTTENLADWILDPHDAKPGNLMPPTDLAPQQLDDLLAYLEGLR